jgi:hypothetical protein
MCDFPQCTKKLGEGHTRRLSAVNGARAIRGQRSHGEGHRYAVVTSGIDFRGAKDLASGDMKTVGRRFDRHAHTLHVGFDGGDAVGFFDPQLGGIADYQAALAGGAQNGERRNLVDQRGGQCALNDAAPDFRCADTQAANKFTTTFLDIHDLY